MFFYIITVIYNQQIKDCPVMNIIDNASFADFIFVDNSTNDDICKFNNNFCKEKRITYLDMHGNAGLSKAYNFAISKINKEADKWIIICDQDTEINGNFLQCYRNAILENPEKKIFCPIINDIKGIMSPAKIKGKKYSHSQKTEFNNSITNYSFINSCMCINSILFKSVQYDENLFLDCVDHDFVKTVREIFKEDIFYVIPELIVFQNFSCVSVNSFESDLYRFKIYLKDSRYFYLKWYNQLVSINISILLRAVILSLKHTDVTFIKVFFNKSS